MTLQDDIASTDDSAEAPAQLIMTLAPERLAELEALRQALGVPDLTGAVSTALEIAQWAVAERNRGRVLASVDEAQGSYTELRFPRG